MVTTCWRLQPGRGRWYARYVRAASRRSAGAVSRSAKDPKIDTSVSLWKGALKPLAAAGFIATFAGLIFHYIGIGPNKEVDDDEEDHHE
ncbi:formate dehydrogenase N subunit beta transmembrane domain-containing protein [Escherichia coli]